MDDIGIELDSDQREKLLAAIASEYQKNPPTIGVLGLSGVGKSSTINAMFGTRLNVSASIRGTSRFHNNKFGLDGKKIMKKGVSGVLHVMDAPGLGEDLAKDKNYLKAYRKHLPKCDVALWIMSARNRALALDQLYFEELKKSLPKVVLGINQVDLIEPLDWDDYYNIPSLKQEEHLSEIIEDRRKKLSPYIEPDTPLIGYSAINYFNLQTLFTACIEAVEDERRWLFTMLKAFSTADWLAGASGLSEEQRENYLHREDKKGPKIEQDVVNHALKNVGS